VALITGGLAFSSCSIPSDAPIWDTRWGVPAEGVSVQVSEILPDRMTVTPDGTAFAVEVDPFAFSQTLADACPPCDALDGQTGPKPAFVTSLDGLGELPAKVLSVDVDHVLVRVSITNGLSFDPLRPGAGNQGTMMLRAYNGGPESELLAEIEVDGADQGFVPGSTLVLEVTVQEITVDEAVRVVLSIDSPAGDTVLLDSSGSIDVLVVTDVVRVSSARIEVAGETFAADPVELDVGDIEQSLVDRIQSGALDILVENPFGVAGSFLARIGGPFPDIVKSMTFTEEPASVTRVEFSQEELRTFLGQSGVILSGTGTVSPAATPIQVTPGDSLRIESRLDITLRIGD
jgi:hypothetical protein